MSGPFFVPFCFSPGLCPLLFRTLLPLLVCIFSKTACLLFLCSACPYSVFLPLYRMSLLVFRRCLHMPLSSLFYLACFPRAARRHPPVFFNLARFPGLSTFTPLHAPSRPFTPLHTSPRPPPSILLYALRDALSTHPDGWAEIMVKSLHCLAPSVPRPSSFSPYIAFLRLFVRRISSFVGMIP